MRDINIKMGQEFFIINSKYPKNQKKYIQYYAGSNDKFKIFLKFDKLILLKKINDKAFSEFIFITKEV